MNEIIEVSVTKQVTQVKTSLACKCGCGTVVDTSKTRRCTGCGDLFPVKCLVSDFENYYGNICGDYPDHRCVFCERAYRRLKKYAEREIKRHDERLNE